MRSRREGSREAIAAGIEPAGSQTTRTAIGSPDQRGRSRMRRREFIAGLGIAAAWQVVARAQQPALPVIGFLNSQNDEYRDVIISFFQGLKETGFVVGQNVA